MSGILASIVDQISAYATRHRNRPFLQGSMAACALIAMADGKVSFGERVRVDQIMQTLTALKVFDPHEGVDLFNDFADAIAASPKAGRSRALDAIRAAAATAEETDLLIWLCLAVSEADGEVSLADQIEIVMLCGTLGADPQAFGLYREDELR